MRASAFVVAACFLLTALPARAQEVPLAGFTPEEAAFIEARGPIRFIVTDLAPWLFPDERGDPAGISFDIIRLMRVKTGLQFQPVPMPSLGAGLAAIQAGEADAWAVTSPGPGREGLLFLEPYAVTGIQAWGPEASVPLAQRDFAGARVAVVRNSTQAALLASIYPDATPVTVATQADAFAALAGGTADAWMGLQATILYFARAESATDIVPLTPVLTEQTMHLALRSDDANLGAILAKALARVDRDELRSIFLRWTGQDLGIQTPAPPTVPLRIVGYSAAAILVGTVAIGAPIWIATLRRRVAARTEEVHRLNEALEARVAERTRELKSANNELEAFAYSVSHDLRAPLRAIDGFSKALLVDHSAELDASARADLERVRAGSQRMGRLIEDLLGLSRIGRAPTNPRDLDLSATASSIVQGLRARDPTREVVTIVAPGLRATGDPQLVEIALTQLMENAWKFTSRREKATIEFGRASTPRGNALFVRDDGAGFEPEFAGKLFTPFQRLHAPTEFPGTGIGLATVKRIIARHGGDVWAEGAPGKGATFYFTLPQDRVLPERKDVTA